VRAALIHGEQLGTAVDGEEQPAGPARPGSQLRVDLADLRAADDRDVNGELTQRLDALSQ
jgi:hypothetical protein